MKKFTYSFLSILMLLLAMPAGLLARTTVTFDFAANPWGLTTSSGSDKKGTITAPITQDGVVLTTVSNNDQNPNQLFGGKSASLRVYNESTFTFTAPEGKVIEKIEFTGTVAATADAGTYDGSSKTWTQPKEQVNAVKFKATGTNKISKAVLTIANPGEGAEVVVLPEIADFASLKACEKDKAVKLTVTNGKVVYAGSNDLIVEDATGAIDFYKWGIKATAGQVINGVVEAKYDEFLGMPQAAKTANTDVAALTITDGEAVAPVAMEFADAMKATSYLKYVTLADFAIENEVVGEGETAKTVTYLVSGENKIQLFNKFKVEYTLPENIKSISGIIIPFVAKGSTDVVVEIAPTCAEDIVAATAAYTEVNSIAELRAIKFEDEYAEVPVKINLHDAKITVLHKSSDYGMEMIDFAILEDATGAIDASTLMMEATAEGTLEGDFAEGSVLNGTLYATLNWPNTLWASEDTEKSQITPTPSTVVPTEATLAEVIKPENDLRLFKLQDVTIKNVGTEETPDFDICQGEASIELRDAFAKWAKDGSDMPEKLKSVTGILYAGYESLDQETPNYFFTPLSYEAASAAPIEVNSIAELNKLGEENEGATIKLKLTDAQITVADASMSSAIIEDKTGAFNAQYFFAEAVGTEMLKDEFKQGVVLNGYLYAKYSYGSIEVCENTANSDITTTEAPVVPTEADFAEVLKAENNYRLYEFKGITVNKNKDDHFQLVKGDAKAEIADGTRSLEESMMATVESVVGYFRVKGDEAEFTLISYKTATPDGISSIEVAAKNAAVYNLNGAKVRNIGESVKGLAKGIYLVGGKKIVVK